VLLAPEVFPNMAQGGGGRRSSVRERESAARIGSDGMESASCGVITGSTWGGGHHHRPSSPWIGTPGHGHVLDTKTFGRHQDSVSCGQVTRPTILLPIRYP